MNPTAEMLKRGRMTADLLHRFVEIHDNFRHNIIFRPKPFDFPQHAKDAKMVRECIEEIKKSTFSSTICIPRDHIASMFGFRLLDYQLELANAISAYEDYVLFREHHQGWKCLTGVAGWLRARKKYTSAVKRYQSEGVKLTILWNEIEDNEKWA